MYLLTYLYSVHQVDLSQGEAFQGRELVEAAATHY